MGLRAKLLVIRKPLMIKNVKTEMHPNESPLVIVKRGSAVDDPIVSAKE